MTLNQIKYMVKVAEYGSINKVASMSFVSQSVISTAIKNLEQELGRSLFIRTAKGVVLTLRQNVSCLYHTDLRADPPHRQHGLSEGQASQSAAPHRVEWLQLSQHVPQRHLQQI